MLTSMKTKLIRSTIAGLCGVLVSGCDIRSDSVSLQWSSGLTEIASYEYTSSGSAKADGSSTIQLSLRLLNKNGGAIKGKAPRFEVVSGNDIQSASGLPDQQYCSISNAEGRSFCYFKSATAGSKEIKFVNFPGTPVKSLVFESVTGVAGFATTQGGKTGFTGSGYKLHMSVADSVTGTQVSTTSGYKVILEPNISN